jgi:hypothetical protein
MPAALDAAVSFSRSTSQKIAYCQHNIRLRRDQGLICFYSLTIIAIFKNANVDVLRLLGRAQRIYRSGDTCGALKIVAYSTRSQRTTELFPR